MHISDLHASCPRTESLHEDGVVKRALHRSADHTVAHSQFQSTKTSKVQNWYKDFQASLALKRQSILLHQCHVVHQTLCYLCCCLLLEAIGPPLQFSLGNCHKDGRRSRTVPLECRRESSSNNCFSPGPVELFATCNAQELLRFQAKPEHQSGPRQEVGPCNFVSCDQKRVMSVL